jgi:hypothetical protein
MTTTLNIERHLEGIPLGKPFVSSQIVRLGTRAAADQALSRMAKAGRIVRVARGVYVKPRQSAIVGTVLPGAFAVAQAICEQEGSRLAATGAAWAYKFGLTTQLTASPTYLTDGSTRHVRIGKALLTLLHASPKAMRLSSVPAGQAILALEWLMEPERPAAAIQKIREALSKEEFREFLREAKLTGGWIARAVSRSGAPGRGGR